jgi:hypothetical protein
MKKSYLTVVPILICLLGLGGSARAQDSSKIVVNVPFDFVAGGETLSAGRYSVSRVFPEAGLVMSSYDESVLLLPIVFDGVLSDHAALGFEQIGYKYFLSKVETPAGLYVIGTPRAKPALAQMKDHGTLSLSGTN